MKLGDIFNKGLDWSVDVYNDYVDEDFAAIETSVKITKEGREKYRFVLNLEVNDFDEDGVEVHLEDDFQAHDLKMFCLAQAGYISESEYDKYFKV